MSTELSSAKYLPPELTENVDVVVGNSEVEVAIAGHQIADPSQPLQASPAPNYAEVVTAARRPTQTPTLVSAIMIFLAIAGVIGVISSLFGVMGQLAVSSIDVHEMTSAMQGNSQQAEIMRRTIATQQQFSLVVFLHNGICFLVGIGFLASCVLLNKKRIDANSFASTACFAAIFYNILTLVVTWVMMPSLKGIPDLPEDAMAVGVAIAMGIAVVFTAIKLGFYGLIIAYLSSASVKAVYAPADQTLPNATVA